MEHFDNLNSNLIKTALIQKMVFTVGFQLIGAVLKSKRPLQFKSENGVFTGELDYSPLEKAKNARIRWQVLQDYVRTVDVKVASIEEIIQSYIQSAAKPVTATPDSVLELRARVTGQSVITMRKQAERGEERARAKIEEGIRKCANEFKDLEEYANEWYKGIDDYGETITTSIEIVDIFTNEWVIENYPKAVKSQCDYWKRWNNWDDAELLLIDADQQMIGR